MSLPLNPQDGKILVALARGTIAEGLGLQVPETPAPTPALKEKGACLVALQVRDRPRGCIISPEPLKPLYEDALHNAQSAAFDDPRYGRLLPADFPELRLRISVFTPHELVKADSEAELLRQLRPGLDGLVLKEGWRKACMLPSAWEELSGPQEFLDELRLKAGLPEDHWSEMMKFYRFEVADFE